MGTSTDMFGVGSRRLRGRWLAPLGAVLASTLGASGCVGSAEQGKPESTQSTQGDQPGVQAGAVGSPADFEVADMAEARGIALDEARRRLEVQAGLEQFSERVSADLGKRSGGIWVDVEDDDRIKVGITDSSGMNVEAMRQAWTARGMSQGDFDIVPTGYSWEELEQANDWLASEIVRVNAGARATLSAGINTPLNAVVLEVPPEEAMAEAQRLVVSEAHARLGGLLQLGHYAGEGEADLCDDWACDPPLRAGIQITDKATIEQHCTLGFTARSSSNAFYAFTAGHCAAATGGVTNSQWLVFSPSLPGLDLGFVGKMRFSS